MILWTVETLNKDIDDEHASLPLDMRGRFVRVSHLVEEFGPFKVGMPHIFIKKTAKTPPKAIKIALERAKEAGLL